MLEKCELFKGVSEENLNEILSKGEIRRFRPGEYILVEGEEGDEFFIILKGKVEVSSKGSVIAIIEEGGFFGEMALLNRTRRSASVKAIEETEVFVLHRDNFIELLRMNPNAGFMLLKTLSERLRKSNERVIEEVKRETRLSTLGKVAGTVIHDLKGPISVIKGYLEFLGKEDLPYEERRDIVQILKGEVEKLLEIIQDFLEFSRGKETLNPVPAQIKNLLLNMVEPMGNLLKEKGVEVSIKGEDQCCLVDPFKIKRVFYNLIMNAIEAGETTKLEMVIEREGDHCRISVIDNGPGIPPEVLGRIFEPFFTSKSGGTGLGLTIVKKIVEDHGGRIEVKSEINKGTEFTVWLPLC